MKKTIDPKTLGLDSRTVIEKSVKGHLYLVMDRKSRIIMADGKKILDKVDKIRASLPGTEVHIKTSAPVCSKTRAWLEKHKINVLEI